MSEALEMERLWTVRELAQYLNYQESSVRTLSSTAPERLPPKVPGLGRPRWNPETVRKWALTPEVIVQKKRPGRPRVNQAF